MSRHDPLLSVVIPVYGSERYLEATVRELVAELDAVASFEIVLVNDASPDGVQAVLDRLCRTDSRVRGITLARNVGQHRATLRGMAASRGAIVVTVDDDGQNPPAAALAVARALRDEDVDVVYGRFQQIEQSALRRMASRLNRWISRATLTNRKALSISNVRALRGDLARWLARTESTYPYLDALVFKATSHISEVGVPHRPRANGGSTYSLRKLFALWFAHLTSLTVVPLQVAVVGSFGISALGLVAGLYGLIRALVERRAPEGWLSLYCAITFLFSVLFAFLGIVSAYVGRMYVSMNERGLVWERPARGDQAAEAGGDAMAGGLR